MLRIAYLGPEGSYSHMAVKAMCQGGNYLPQSSFYAVVQCLLSGGADAAVLPIQNSLNGGVTQNLDLLQAHNCLAVREYTLTVDHRLATLPNADVSKIERIYSHSQALEQCAVYLSNAHPNANLVAVQSTADGARMVKLPTEAAIASPQCGIKGLQFSAQSIADQPENLTRFLWIERGGERAVHTQKVYFSAVCMHRAGALYHLLGVLAKSGVNMTKIESRPIKDSVGEFRFFIEIEGDYLSPAVQTALAEMRKQTADFKILGQY